MDCSKPGFPLLHNLLEFAQTYVHWVSDAIQPSHPLSPPSPPALNLSQQQGLFQWVGSSHQGLKYWSFSFSITPSHEYSGLISFRIDWFHFLAVQGALKSLLQHLNSEVSILWYLLRVGHDWATSLSLFTFMYWRRKWQPTPVFLPGESQGQGSLVGCCLWGCTELDTTEAT